MYLANLNLNSPMWLVATELDSELYFYTRTFFSDKLDISAFSLSFLLSFNFLSTIINQF